MKDDANQHGHPRRTVDALRLVALRCCCRWRLAPPRRRRCAGTPVAADGRHRGHATSHRTIAPPVASRQIAYAPPPRAAMPLAAGFDVRAVRSDGAGAGRDQRVPGLAMAIVQNGRVLSARGYGITDVRAAEPVDAHTVFRLASLSKAFAGTMTGLLVSEGALRWDSQLTDYMPDFQLVAIPAPRSS